MKLIPLSRGLVTQVDDNTYEWASPFKWHALEGLHTFYAVRNVRLPDGRRTLVLLHREILKAPRGVFVDHKDLNGLNNTLKNIRCCSKQQNNRNQALRSDNSSRYKGVNYRKTTGTWIARIQVGAQRFYLGDFATAASAAEAYNTAAIEFFGDFAYLNIIPKL